MSEMPKCCKNAGLGSDTPRTDAEYAARPWFRSRVGHAVKIDFARTLERENAALREEMTLIAKAVGREGDWHELNKDVTALRERCERAEKDSQMMDWLSNPLRCYWVSVQRQPSGDHIFSGQGNGLRAVIDRAIQDSSK